jgi:hypothetical protein
MRYLRHIDPRLEIEWLSDGSHIFLLLVLPPPREKAPVYPSPDPEDRLCPMLERIIPESAEVGCRNTVK